jgi:hypothetical protein
MEGSEAPRRVEPQAIKVEMSEEVRQAQKKQGTRAIYYAVVAAVVGGALGYGIGGSVEKSKVADQALRDASALGKEIKTALASAETLADTLKAAREQLSSGKYPEEEVKKLGELRVPFGGDKLGGRNVGRFKADVSRGLLGFASSAEKVNDQTEIVQRILSGSRKALLDNFAPAAAPKVTWAAYAESTNTGPMLTMIPLPEPFAVKTDKGWPAELKVKVEGKDKSYKRYTKGDPAGSDPLLIPVDPGSQGAVCPSDVLSRVARQVQELENLLRGGKDPTTGEEEAGFMDAGRAVEEKLKQIGTPG